MKVSYEEFLDIFKDRVSSFLGDELSEYEIEFSTVNKVNAKLDAFSLVKKENIDSDECIVAPTLYVNDFYDEYQQCDFIDILIHKAVRTLKEGLDFPKSSFVEFTDAEKCKSNLSFQLVNYERNREFLSNVPHRRILDLAVVYRVVAKADDTGITSCIITYDLLKHLGISEEQLHLSAYNNYQKMFPFSLRAIEKPDEEIAIKGCINSQGTVNLSQIDVVLDAYIITNEFHFCASNALMYSGFLKKVSETLDSDLYILPSSIHDLIVVKADRPDMIENLKSIVTNVNSCGTPDRDVLSNNVYFYSKEELEVRIPYEVS